MKILFDIGHPAHVHLFKHLIRLLKNDNNEVFVTAREKDITLQLLEEEKIPFKLLGRNHPGLLGKLKNLFEYDYLLYKYSKTVKPDVFISHSSIYAAHSAFFLRKKSITLEDTGNADQSLFYRPFTNWILTPQCLNKKYGRKQLKYNGFHELAYLHPDYFKPDISILDELNIKHGEKYCIVRFVSRNASHDIGIKGLNLSQKLRVVDELSKYSKVLITSEDTLPDELKPFQLKIAYSKIHHVIAFADLVFGESATMSSEAAMLGVPAVFLDKQGRHYTDFQQQKYNLVFNFVRKNYDIHKALLCAKDLLTGDNTQSEFKMRSKQLIEDHIDVTKFLYDFIKLKLNHQ